MTDGTRRLWAVGLLLVAGLPARARAGEPGPYLADDPTLIALAVALSCADGAGGEPAASADPAARPEVELVATVRARAVRFEVVPVVDAAALQGARRRTSWRTERVNLPARPEAGVWYRDVELRITIASDAEELTALLAQAQRASQGIQIEEEAGAPAAVASTGPAGGAPALTSAPPAPSPAAPEPSPANPVATAVASADQDPSAAGTTMTVPAEAATPASTPNATPSAIPSATATPTAIPAPTATTTATPTATTTTIPAPTADLPPVPAAASR